MSASLPLTRGDIVITAFPFTDLSGSKRRPAVVLATNIGHPDVILAFISSVLPSQFAVYDIPLLPADKDFPQSGLKVPSVIRTNKLATIDRLLVTRRIGALAAQRLQLVDEKLILSLGINLQLFYQQEHRRLNQLLKQKGTEALIDLIQSS